jgi:hypothetical protein
MVLLCSKLDDAQYIFKSSTHKTAILIDVWNATKCTNSVNVMTIFT